jgi:hypothetical protein
VKWDEATTNLEDVLLKSYEQSNPSDDFVVPKWRPVEAMEVGIHHR